MEDFKKNYELTLSMLRKRQNELGLTNIEMANWLSIKPSNYERLINGKYPMSVPRFEQVCSVLGYGYCLIEEDLVNDFQKCVDEELEDIAVVDGNL